MRTPLLIATLLAATVLPAAAADELRFAVLVTRHGVRSPTWEPEKLNAYSSAPWPDFGVAPGELTPHGREQMKLMGAFYRGYLTRLGLRALGNCAKPAPAYVWSDVDQRTLESGRALAEGLLPGCTVPVHSAEGKPTDPLFDPIEAGVSKAAPEPALASILGRLGPRPEALLDVHRAAFDTLDYILKGSGKSAKSLFDEPFKLKTGDSLVTMSGPLRTASTLTEVLLLEYGNGIRGEQLGWGRLNARNLQQVMVLHTVYADLLRRNPGMARVRGRQMMERVLGSIEQAAGRKARHALGPAGSSVVVISGHDTNISNLSGLFDLSWVMPGYATDDVPPGGALLFTLWRSPKSGQFTVRTQFVTQTLDQMRDGTPLTEANPPAIADLYVPGCSTSAKGYPCALDDFLATGRRALTARP